MINYIKPILYFIPLLILQVVVIPLISIYNVTPNLVLILVVFYTLKGGQIYGMILGFICGLFFDLFSGGVVGSSMLAMTISSFIAGYFFNENRIDSNITTYFFLVILLIASFANSFIYSFVGNFNPEVKVTVLLLEGALFPAIYTVLFGVGVVVFSARSIKDER